MARKKVDGKIIEVIQRSISSRHRCMFYIVGTKGVDQIPILYHQLLRCREDAGLEKPSVLWTYKKEIGFSGRHQKKKIKTLRQKYYFFHSLLKEDVFNHFLLSAKPQFCHYSETDRVLGQSFSMLICQDYEAVTPNTLARITECVEGGGACIFLLPFGIYSLGNIWMDAHSRYITEKYNAIVPLFNQRLLYSLRSCSSCFVLNDSLGVTWPPKDSDMAVEEETTLQEIPDCLSDLECSVFSLCRTNDQLTALRCLHGALYSDRRTVVSLTAGRGRGKSAVLGLAVALALASGLRNVLLTSPYVDNLQTLFAFVVQGLNASGWVEGPDLQVIRNDSELTIGIRILRNRRQFLKYLPPVDPSAGRDADLLVIDEAAAIPLPLVKKWMKPEYTVFMASTVQGYEGTGRSLSLKLLNQLRDPDERNPDLHEVELSEAIRYSNGDPVESWLERILCLDACNNNIFLDGELPLAKNLKLFFVNRKALFSGRSTAEVFLQRLVSLFVSSHYKNSPNDLFMLADAPAHRLFCLMDPDSPDTPLCAIQVAMEGGLSPETCLSEQENGRRGAGDLIPWIVSQQFQEELFLQRRSGRIVRMATHSDCQGMGYGSHALDLLSDFYSAPRKYYPMPSKDKLLWSLEEVPFVEKLTYLGVSYGLTPELLKFWKRAGFLPLYIRQTKSDVTGEHSCVMVKSLEVDNSWVENFCTDFQGRFAALLPTAFRELPSTTVNMVLKAQETRECPIPILYNDIPLSTKLQLVNERELARLMAYRRREVDYHMVLDIMPKLVTLVPGLNYAHGCIMVCVGLQGKSVEQTAEEMNFEPSQVMSFFRKAVSKMLAGLKAKVFEEHKAIEHNKCTECVRSYLTTLQEGRPNEETT